MARAKTMSSLESRLKELEELTGKIESGKLPIDQAIEVYSQGMALALSCKKTLDEMSQKISAAKKQSHDALKESEDSPKLPESSPAEDEDLPF